jgi:hypothetical protein
LAVLLRGVALTVLLQGDARVFTARSEHLFHKSASVPWATSQGSGNPSVSDPRMRQTGNRTGRLNKPREEISAMFITDIQCEIRKVNNQC